MTEPKLTLEMIDSLAGDERRATRLLIFLARIPAEHRGRIFVSLCNQSELYFDGLGVIAIEFREKMNHYIQKGADRHHAYLDALLDLAL